MKGSNGSISVGGRDRLLRESAALEALLPHDAPAHLVGHSSGAAVALRIAGANRVRSMAPYEPAIWGTLSHLCPGDPAALAIEAVRDALPAASVVELDGLSHLGPITHPERVDAAIEAFLSSAARRRPRVHC